MRYPDYLVHFNPNHDPKTGQFANGPKLTTAQRQRVSKKIYAKLSKNKDAKSVRESLKNNEALKDAVKDEKLQAAFQKLNNTKYDLEEYPDWYDFEDVVNSATKAFNKDYPNWDKNPSDHKMFDYYMEAAADKSKAYNDRLGKYAQSLKNSNWEKVNEEYFSEARRVAEDFTGKYYNKPLGYSTYADQVRYSINEVLHEI